MAIDSIPARLFEKARSMGQREAYHVKSGSRWAATDFATYAAQVKQAARALITLGLEPGGTVCILGYNKPEWVIFDVAAMAAGGAPAGIYTTCSPPEVQYIVDHAESAIVLVENTEQWEKIRAQRDNLPKLKWVITMKDAGTVDDDMVLTWDEFMAKAESTPESTVDERLEALTEDQVATLIYTSGTTGPPKAVMLSHKNLAWTADIALQITSVREEDCSVSYLPLSHIAEQMFSIHVPITAGSSVYYAESLEKLLDNLKEVRPTVIFGVPRIWEKFYAALSNKMSQATGIKAKLVDFAMRTGREANAVRNEGKEPSGMLAFKYSLANKLIYSKVKPALGLDRARICVSGAAPISAEILEFFAGLDIVIHEVYGQSEDTGPTSFNLPGKTRFGTVGPALAGVDVRIADDGEILVKGPNVFLGYYKDQAATDETLIDGWLHSGDLGQFDADGFLSITGRKKEIIITAGGKNIAPKNIEAALKNHELISQAVIIGDRRKYLSALLTLDPEAAERFAQANGLPPQDLHKSQKLNDAVQQVVESVNQQFARVEHIRKFTILEHDFQPVGDLPELTPTLKIKRKVVNEKYAPQIEAMYKDA